ncbi:hypothetical protein Aru02nite_04390 [Actinocatenispora rupis]|uniref:Uncharacterized protein n=1 Tax=Actinocatenispora rupis TaxID=519421 RepID=A0A8J3J022_9ACTN|nr:hypothetical protein Aru02nite_04390 [Actinocatenispora rupis]
MAGGDELPDETVADESGGTGDEYGHRKGPVCVAARTPGTPKKPTKGVAAGCRE